MASSEEMRRALGCFYGQLIGDALGSRYEFGDRPTTMRKLAEDKQAHGERLVLLGGGPFSMAPGQITDDSEMALSLGRSLVHCRGFNAADVACAYTFWAQSNPPDIGITTQSALAIEGTMPGNWRSVLNDEEKRAVHQEVRRRVDSLCTDSLSNGMLMRISPLAIAFCHAPSEKLKTMAKEDCLLTHSNPTVVEATEVYVQALASLIKGARPEDVHEEAEQNASSSLIRDILHRARQAPTPVPLANGQLTEGDKRSVGYFGVALQSAFYELQHATDFASGLENAVARGGDTDTNGCIVGAMLGARFGADAVPQEWITAVKNAKSRNTKLDFVAVPDAEALVSDLLSISCHHRDSVK